MATWADIQRGIFAGESGGDYGALFNYQNRPDGRFSNVDLTQMTVDEALQFSDPSGPYAQYVKGQVGRVATPMGAYQVVGTTLRSAKQGLGLTGNERMTPELQDRIGRWIYETQGTGAWEGYKGPRVSTKEGSPMDQMQQPQQRDTLLSRLTSPRTIRDLASLSRSGFGRQLAQVAQADLDRQQAMEDEQRKLGQAQQQANRTAAWLRTQPEGDSYADAIEKGGIDAKTIYTQYVSDRNDLNSPNVQSSKMLPDSSGSVLTMRDGSLVVKTVGGETLTGQEAMDFVAKAGATYAQQQQDIYGARRTGTLEADVELGGAAEAAKTEGKMRPEMARDFFNQSALVKSNITNLNDAITAIDQGAQSGIVYNMLPNITEASASLNNAMNRMGLDVIGSVTFGALSEGEMRLAMETAVPRNLSETQLRSWLVKKRDAQQKALEALNNAALWFAGGGTLEGYLQDQGKGETTSSDNPLGLE